VRGRRRTETTGWSSLESTRRSSRSSTRSTACGKRRRSERSTTRSPSTTATHLERLRQPLLAGALLRRREGHHPRPPLRRGALRAIRAGHPAAARRRARARLRRRGRRGGGGDWEHLRTPETYLGYGRSEHFASPDGAAFDQRGAYELPSACASTTGRSPASGRSGVRKSRSTRPAAASPAGSTRDAHLVLSRGSREPIPFRVLLDGEAPGPTHGVDVDAEGHGVLRDGRMHQLVRERATVRERTLEITSSSPAPRRTCSSMRSSP
jgi:hypothetical protein